MKEHSNPMQTTVETHATSNTTDGDFNGGADGDSQGQEGDILLCTYTLRMECVN